MYEQDDMFENAPRGRVIERMSKSGYPEDSIMYNVPMCIHCNKK